MSVRTALRPAGNVGPMRVDFSFAVRSAVRVALTVGLVGWSVGCQRPAVAPGAIESADRSGSGPGSLVSATSMPAVESQLSGGRAARVVYRSTEGGTGRPTVVSGAVFVPAADPPATGWPVVAIGHGSVGIDESCAPSLSADLLGDLPLVIAVLGQGYAVAVADYQGLGSPGVHPYLDARTAGLNVIDSVRALRATFPGVSARWGAYGASQGGGAVWAADEQAAVHAAELELVGAVAAAPAVDVSGVVDKAVAHSLTTDQTTALQWILAAAGRIRPDLDLDEFRRGAAAENWDVLSACSGPAAERRGEVIGTLRQQDLAPSSATAAAKLRGILADWALPQRKLSAPISVVYGAEDTVVDPEWTTAAISRACALGGSVTASLQPDKGHGDIDTAAQLGWLADRFAGREVPAGCT